MTVGIVACSEQRIYMCHYICHDFDKACKCCTQCFSIQSCTSDTGPPPSNEKTNNEKTNNLDFPLGPRITVLP